MDVHYATVGQALVWTLQKGLGDEFTSATRDAWIAAFTMMAPVMQRAPVRCRTPSESRA